MDLKQSLHDIQQLITKNELANAEKKLLVLEQQYPNQAEILHLHSLIYIKQEQFDKAKNLTEQALNLQPNSALLLNHLGNIYKHLGNYEQAEIFFNKALIIAPHYAEALNNYGLLHYQKNDFTAAEKLFTQALKAKTDYTESMYNLALALKAQQKIEDCVASLMAILEATPQHFPARFLLAQLLLEKKIYQDAIRHLQIIYDYNKKDLAILGSIIYLLLQHDQFIAAKPFCEKYLTLRPKTTEILYNLGVIANHKEDKNTAISYYLAALATNPNYFPALNNLAVLNLEQNNIETAKYYFQKALEQRPNDEAIIHVLNAITGNLSADTAPYTYIEKLFDSYAEHFEKHLCQSLEYCVPEKIKSLIEQTQNISSSPQWNILDLGCGTGLSGEIFKRWSSHLTGVDLSTKMIAMAQQKNCYDELFVTENKQFLADKHSLYDLIIAADVFVYQGELQSIFANCYQALKHNGLFVFTTEIHSGDNFTMQATGRFCHSKNYIETLAKRTGFTIIARETEKTRLQGSQPLSGYYFVLKKR